MGVVRKLFGKYLLLTNTGTCGLMMVFGDLLQQRAVHWKRTCDENPPNQFLSKRVNLVHASTFDPSVKEADAKKQQILYVDKNESDKEYKHDYARTKNMLTVGIALGPFHHYFYAMLDRVWPKRNTVTILKKTLVDQLVASPVCLAIFFFGLGLMEERKLVDINDEVKLKFGDTWKADWCFWPPTQVINFWLVPTQYRVLYINLMTMVYDIFLSYMKYVSSMYCCRFLLISLAITPYYRLTEDTGREIRVKESRKATNRGIERKI